MARWRAIRWRGGANLLRCRTGCCASFGGNRDVEGEKIAAGVPCFRCRGPRARSGRGRRQAVHLRREDQQADGAAAERAGVLHRAGQRQGGPSQRDRNAGPPDRFPPPGRVEIGRQGGPAPDRRQAGRPCQAPGTERARTDRRPAVDAFAPNGAVSVPIPTCRWGSATSALPTSRTARSTTSTTRMDDEFIGSGRAT